MAAAMLLAALWTVYTRRGSWRLDAASATFAALAAVPLIQATGGMFMFPGEAPLVSQYLTGIALMLLVARHAQEAERLRLADALFAGLAIASIISTGIAIYQWLGLDGVGVLLVTAPPASRPTANVGQPNNLATLLVWGLVALWWAYARRSIGGWGASIAAAFLLAGVVITQSRTGMLGVALLALWPILFSRVPGIKVQTRTWLALACWFVALVAALQPLSRALLGESTRSLLDAAAPQERISILRMSVAAIEHRPLFGYGWNQTVAAHVELAEKFPLKQTVGHAHNVVLDLMLWMGVPLALMLVSGLCVWLWRRVRAIGTKEEALLMLGLVILSLHASLELPHVLALFLLPAAVMAGTLNADGRFDTRYRIPRPPLIAIVVLHAALVGMLFREYVGIESFATSQRMRAARIGDLAAEPLPDAYVLRPLRDALATLGTEPRRDMSAEQLDLLRRTVFRYPNPGALFRYALSSALNGNSAEAKWALEVLCNLNSAVVCRAAVDGWEGLAAGGMPELGFVPMPRTDLHGSPPRSRHN